MPITRQTKYVGVCLKVLLPVAEVDIPDAKALRRNKLFLTLPTIAVNGGNGGVVVEKPFFMVKFFLDPNLEKNKDFWSRQLCLFPRLPMVIQKSLYTNLFSTIRQLCF